MIVAFTVPLIVPGGTWKVMVTMRASSLPRVAGLGVMAGFHPPWVANVNVSVAVPVFVNVWVKVTTCPGRPIAAWSEANSTPKVRLTYVVSVTTAHTVVGLTREVAVMTDRKSVVRE